MNPILEEIIKARQGHYCHVIEVCDPYELEVLAESIIEEYSERYSEDQIIDFLESLTIYSLCDDKEEAIYSFSFKEFIQGTI